MGELSDCDTDQLRVQQRDTEGYRPQESLATAWSQNSATERNRYDLGRPSAANPQIG